MIYCYLINISYRPSPAQSQRSWRLFPRTSPRAGIASLCSSATCAKNASALTGQHPHRGRRCDQRHRDPWYWPRDRLDSDHRRDAGQRGCQLHRDAAVQAEAEPARSRRRVICDIQLEPHRDQPQTWAAR